MTNTYLLFVYECQYPQGGMSDCLATFIASDDDAAINKAKEILDEQNPIGEMIELVRLLEVNEVSGQVYWRAIVLEDVPSFRD